MPDLYLHDGATSFSIVVKGALKRPDTAEVEHAWRTAASILQNKQLVVNIAEVSEVDEEGARLLQAMSRAGAHLVSASEMTDALAKKLSEREPVVIPPPAMGWISRLLCRFRRCCGRVRPHPEADRRCDAHPLKIW